MVTTEHTETCCDTDDQPTRYRLHELDERLQDRILERWSGAEWEAIEPSGITELFCQILEEKGYPTEDIRWSLSYCQGDGVAFYGSVSTAGFKQIVERVLPENHPLRLRMMLYAADFDLLSELSLGLTRRGWGNYDHYNTMEVDLYYYDANVEEEDNAFCQEAVQVLEPLILEEVQDLSQELESLGYSELEYLTGKDRGREELSDRWYTEDGEEIDE